jgi:hypothetical protein
MAFLIPLNRGSTRDLHRGEMLIIAKREMQQAKRMIELNSNIDRQDSEVIRDDLCKV